MSVHPAVTDWTPTTKLKATSPSAPRLTTQYHEVSDTVRHDFLSDHPRPAAAGEDLDAQQKALIRLQEQRLAGMLDRLRPFCRLDMRLRLCE